MENHTDTLVGDTATIVGNIDTLVGDTDTLVGNTDTLVGDDDTGLPIVLLQEHNGQRWGSLFFNQCNSL